MRDEQSFCQGDGRMDARAEEDARRVEVWTTFRCKLSLHLKREVCYSLTRGYFPVTAIGLAWSAAARPLLVHCAFWVVARI